MSLAVDSADARPLAVTMGDPAGVGLDVTIAAWRMRAARGLPPFVLYGDPRAAGARAKDIGPEIAVAAIGQPNEARDVFRHSLPVIPVELDAPAPPGSPAPENAAAVIDSIERAVSAVLSQAARAVVANPIAKAGLYAAGFAFPGHTEFLAALAERRQPGQPVTPVMMLVSDDLRVAPLTIHIPLAQVPAAITRERILKTARVLCDALRRDFGVAEPRIAVAGLNPHAGEGGALGREEADIITPALADLRAEGMAVTGPHPADTLFHAAARKTYDAVLAMYHDQALAPFKTLAFDTGVNVTLGLPFVRTSPDHGTAFSIAGTGRASPESFIAALKLADEMAARRQSGRETASICR